jgi:uncharacterized protein (DUF1015 family)
MELPSFVSFHFAKPEAPRKINAGRALVLQAEDPKVARNVKFVGGSAGFQALEVAAFTNDSLTFAVPSLSLEELFTVADMQWLMPPKSTWFTSKPGAGLVIRMFERDNEWLTKNY